MRVYIKLQSNGKPVPFNYQPMITGIIHKWIGQNEIHNQTSMYSFSWLSGGRKKGEYLIFDNETSFEFSAYDSEIVKRLIRGIQANPEINYGLKVSEILLMETPNFTNKQTFYVTSPVLVKRTDEKRKEIHFTYDQLESDTWLTETLKRKLQRAGLDDSNVQVSFDRTYSGAKTKLIYYKSIGNKVNVCPVIIDGTPEQIAFAWNVGVGNSTGIGFGSLK